MATRPAKKQVKKAVRKPRADAQKNRQRILEVARAAFTRAGADVSLDEIAKAAKIGPGTLYRHFPTRDALLEAVYLTELEKLAGAEKTFSETMMPVDALRAWLRMLVEYLAAKQIIAPALKEMVGGPSKLFQVSGNKIKAAIEALVHRAVASGDMRADLEPLDLVRALMGVSNVASAPTWKENAIRMIDVLIAGSRPSMSSAREQLHR
jgi:AcrR family transcriptional regulator